MYKWLQVFHTELLGKSGKILTKRSELYHESKQADKNIYKRGEYSYQVKMMVGGQQISENFRYLARGTDLRDLQRAGSASIWMKAYLRGQGKKREAKTYTVLQALQRYEKEVTQQKKSQR